MSLSVVCSKLTASPGDRGWSQIHDFTPSDENKMASHGRLIAVISASGEFGEVNTLEVGREILARIHEEYFGKEAINHLSLLKEAIETVCKEFSTDGDLVQIGAVVYLNDMAHVAGYGGAVVKLFRRGHFYSLVNSGAVNNVVGLSGNANANDIYLIGTSKVFEIVAQGILQASCETNDPQVSAENIASIIRSYKGTGSPALAMVFLSDRKTSVETSTSSSKNLVSFLDRIISSFSDSKLRINVARESYSAVKPRSKKLIFTGFIALVILVFLVFTGVARKNEKDKELSIKVAQDEKTNLLKSEGIFEANVTKLVDLGLQSENFSGSQLTLDLDTLYILDRDNHNIIQTAIDGSQTKLRSGKDQLTDAIEIAAYPNKLFVLGRNGVKEVNSNKIVVNADFSDQQMLKAFAGNLYTINRQDGSVTRYQYDGSAYSAAKSWLAADTDKITDVVSWSIDGSVWVLGKSGHLFKYSFSRNDVFDDSLLRQKVTTPTVVYTDSDCIDLYLLSPSDKKIYVFSKKGEYLASYTSEYISDAKDIIVSEQLGKIYLLNPKALYSIDIKHL